MKAGNTIVDHLSSCIFCNGIYTEMEVLREVCRLKGPALGT